MKQTTASICVALFIAFAGLFWGYSCTKPTAFGAGLLEEELGEYVYTDTLSLLCTVLPEDSVLTSDRSSTASYFFCGQLNDPVFGRSQSEIFSLFRLRDLNPNFKDAEIDSVVMFVRYAVSGFYGDTLQAQNLRVHRVAAGGQVQWGVDYYSNQSLPAGDLLGEVTNFAPKPNTYIPLFDTITRGPYLRIPLDHAFGQEILDTDSLTLTADTLFWQKIRGIRISAEPAGGGTSAMMALDLNNTTFSMVRLYYKYDQDTITTSRTYDFSFVGGNKFAHFSHDHSGSPVAPYIGQPAEDLLFAQGMGGLRIKVEIPYAHLLDSVAINKAELELTVANLPQSDPALRPVDQLVFTEIIGDTAVSLTPDVLYSLGSTLTGGFSFFGGFAEKEVDNGTTVDRYRMTLTRRFQAMVDNTSGDIKNQTLYINVYPQVRSATRAAFYGPKSATFPAKLALKYTRVR